MKMATPLKTIPDELAVQVGHIVTRWSYLAHLLRRICYTILDVGLKHGRLAIREPRAKDTILMIADLLTVSKLSVGHDLRKLANNLEDLERFRDWVAHGAWSLTPDNTVQLVITAGSWRPPGTTKKISRKIKPAGHPMNVVLLKLISSEIFATAEWIEKLYLEVRGKMKPLQRKSP